MMIPRLKKKKCLFNCSTSEQTDVVLHLVSQTKLLTPIHRGHPRPRASLSDASPKSLAQKPPNSSPNLLEAHDLLDSGVDIEARCMPSKLQGID